MATKCEPEPSTAASPRDSNEESSKNESKRNEKRKRLGRSARRRKAKLRAIQQAEQIAWKNGGEASTAEEQFIPQIPSDRDRVWPGVLRRRNDGILGASEHVALVGQLGFLPGNAVEVAARARNLPYLPLDGETPIVLKLYPLAIRDAYVGGKSGGRKFKARRRGGSDAVATQSTCAEDNVPENSQPLLEPFPTLYWLTHPLLRILISKLEVGSVQNVRIMENRLRSDTIALEAMKRAHQAYGKERWELLTNEDLELIESRKWQGALEPKRGVAGIRKYDCIKCLHAHAAHYLSGGLGSSDNIVGKWVMDAVSELVRERQAGEAAEAASESDTNA